MTPERGSTVDAVLRRSARRTPARVAVEYGERSWTYAELDDAVSRAASVLLGRGLAPGDRVGGGGGGEHAQPTAIHAEPAPARAGGPVSRTQTRAE
ncbi:AMP-binding protein, partial [Streptomyces anandii]|uniref:AMP-binding protein n=1 Tax=Streptomyces anandii TaxID=285454 RepID=UPI00368470D8